MITNSKDGEVYSLQSLESVSHTPECEGDDKEGHSRLRYVRSVRSGVFTTSQFRQGRAFLRWSRHKTAYVVWQEITARRRPGTVYAVLNFLSSTPSS
jgi:hypothetical protein